MTTDKVCQLAYHTGLLTGSLANVSEDPAALTILLDRGITLNTLENLKYCLHEIARSFYKKAEYPLPSTQAESKLI